MNFGDVTELDEASSMCDRALDAGVFFWDTADMYGQGTAEEMLGHLMRGRRQQVVLATKAWAQMGPGPNDRGLSARHLLQACDASLKRLGTDWIDLYYMHLPDRGVRIHETLRAMEDLVRSGKVRYLACSNYFAWEVVDLLRVASRHDWSPVVAAQNPYSLLNRQLEYEFIPMAQHKGLGVVTYSPLARGMLTGKYGAGQVPVGSRLDRKNGRFLQSEWRAESLPVADRLASIAADMGVTSAALATAWVLANQAVHSTVIGPRTLGQLNQYIAGAQIEWTPELEAACDALVSPGTATGSTMPDPAYFPVRGRLVEET
jgi:aryl-alcohol dehydrogenase-like predicted oxidoreductase